MIIQSKKILSQFSPHIASHIVEFCKQLSQIECDVFIVFARKAACFVSVLEDVGILNLPAKVVSERVLDYNTDWLKDKRVVLIDDTIISGTSIHKIIQSLEVIGVKEISVQAFCVNDFWFVKEMLESDSGKSYLKEPFLKLEHTSSLKFCKDIVRAFSIHPRPYSTDFPIYESIHFTEADINQLQSLDQWKIVGTTSILQGEHNITCFSMNPRKEVLQSFFSTLGIPLERHSYLKLRIYGEEFQRKKEKKVDVVCRILPLIIFEPVKHDFLDRIITSVCQTEGVEEKFLRFHLTTSVAKLRFIQFYFAHRFFLYCIGSFSQALGHTLKYNMNNRETDLLFPPDLVQIIKRFEYGNKMELSETDIDHKFLPFQPLPEAPQSLYNPYEITDLLMSQFLKLYYEKEVIARRKIKEFKKEAFKALENRKVINRLSEGYTFGDLKKLLNEKIPYDADQNLILSNFLDSTIDSGIVVPVTLEKDGYTSRGYRHGEEIIWGENNDQLLAIFYKTFLDKTGQSEIGKFWFQKSMVLFLKMGLKARILDEYNSQVAPPQNMHIIAVRSYLFGQVSVQYDLKPSQETKFNPILDYEVKGNWTSKRLQDIGVLTLTESNRFSLDVKYLSEYHQKVSPKEGEPKDLDQKLANKAEEMGELLAIARVNGLLDNEGLVLLTSCLNIHDCLPSIAAEIYLYQESIVQVMDWVRNNAHRKGFSVKFLQTLRNHKENYCWTAVNSGCDKFMDYKDKKADVLIDHISSELGKDRNGGSFKKRAWESYWEKEADDDKNTASDLYLLNDEIGFTLLEANTLMIYLHVLIFEWLDRNGQIQKHIDGKDTEIASRTVQLDKIRKKITSLQPLDNDSRQVKISFDDASRINKLEAEYEEIKKVITADQSNVEFLKTYISKNKERVIKYQNYYKRMILKDMPFSEERIQFLTDAYRSYTEEEVIAAILQIIEKLDSYKTKANELLLRFSALVPQWGKINAVAKYSSIIHVNTVETDERKRRIIRDTVVDIINQFNIDEAPDEVSGERVKSAVRLYHPAKTNANPGLFIGGKGSFAIDRMTKLAGRVVQQCNEMNLNYHLHFFPGLSEEQAVSAFFNKSRQETDEVHEDFIPRFESLENQFQPYDKCILTYNTLRGKKPIEFKNLVKEAIEGGVNFDLMKYKSNTGQNEEMVRIQIGRKEPGQRTCIGVVTALPVEFAGMRAMLDMTNSKFRPPVDDPNDYAQGYIRSNNDQDIEVIIVLMKEMANNHAGVGATNLIRSFPQIEDVIMTGIAGAVPNPENASNHVRLGDVVITDHAGVLQYDKLKDLGTKIVIRDTSSKPSARLIGLCNILESDKHLNKTPWNEFIDKAVTEYPSFLRPDDSKDVLTIKGKKVEHPDDPERKAGYPKVFRGAIGSSNTLLKNEEKRDELRDLYKVKAIEMEGSGIADGTWAFGKGYLLIRGTVDYCNADKNDFWHAYAALAAAAYTKSLIQLL